VSLERNIVNCIVSQPAKGNDHIRYTRFELYAEIEFEPPPDRTNSPKDILIRRSPESKTNRIGARTLTTHLIMWFRRRKIHRNCVHLPESTMPRRAATPARRSPGSTLLSAGRAARDWKPHKGDRPSAGRSTSTTAGGRETGGEAARWRRRKGCVGMGRWRRAGLRSCLV